MFTTQFLASSSHHGLPHGSGEADRPSLLHHQSALDFDDPTLSCAQCPGEAPRSVLPRTAPWTPGKHGTKTLKKQAKNGSKWMGEYGLVLKIVEHHCQLISIGWLVDGLISKFGY